MSRRESVPHVVVIGGGISGLAAAHRLRELDSSIEVTVLESSDRAGGLIRTEHADGFVIERGPDSILTEKPAALELARRLGLSDEIIQTESEHRGALVLSRGRLVRVPEGFSLVAWSRVRPLLSSPVLSWRGKARALVEVILPRGETRSDESLASFVRRRYGNEVLDRLASPLAGGIYGVDPERLSLRATMPRFLDHERDARSVSLALRERDALQGATTSSGARYGLFVSFRRGMETLTNALRDRLGAAIRFRESVTSVVREGGGYRVHTPRDSLRADAAILAAPAHSSARIVKTLDASLSELLSAIPYGSSACVTFAWRKEDIAHPLDAFGFVVPAVENRALIASTWSSTKFKGRAPNGMALVRAFLGRNAVQQVTSAPDDALVDIAKKEMQQLLGVQKPPLLTRVDRYIGSMPSYEVGHLDHVQRIEEKVALFPRLELAGNAYRGVGIPDAVRSGEAAAERTLSQFPREKHS